MSLLEDLYLSFRVADAFDIALVAIFIYTALTWFRQTTSRSVFVGVALLTLVYFAAKALEMHMTVFLFQAVFAVVLVALVVVFQEDLRRAFEGLAALRPVRDRWRSTTAGFAHTDTLVEAISGMAEKRIGALVVIKGGEPLGRHIVGGISTDSQISRPLLDSLFDPHSMGHDGAVVIEDQRIQQFAAHLPLSRNLQEVGARGTRHCAALGLSERCDALCIVVSEERGQISVAEQGKLTTMMTPADLKNRMVGFFEKHYPIETVGFWTRLVRQNARLKVASLLFACLAWFFLVYQAETIQKDFDVPIEFRNRPENLAIETPTPEPAIVTFSGYQQSFNLLVRADLKFSVNLAGFEAGRYRVALDSKSIRGNDGLHVERVEPTSIIVELRPVEETESAPTRPQEVAPRRGPG